MWIGTDPQRERATRAAPTAASARNPSRAAPSASTSPTSRPASGATPHRTPSTATSADAKPPKAPRRNPTRKRPASAGLFRSQDFGLMPEIRHVLPVGLRPPKFQSVNPPSLRSIGIPETPDREAVAWIESFRRMPGLRVAQVPVPSIAATGRRTPPAAVDPGIVEVAIAVAVAARKGRKPKVVRAVAIVVPACCRFQCRAFRPGKSLRCDVVLQFRPLAIGRDMPTRRTQAPSIVYRIPVVQTAIRRQRLRFVARVDVRTVFAQ